MSTITITLTGIVAPVTSLYGTDYGIDGGGYFGPVGESLAGKEFTIVWTGTDCDCYGYNVSVNPIISAVLTINNHSYTYSSGLKDYNDFTSTIQQVQVIPGNVTLTTRYPGYGDKFGSPGHDGVFYIQESDYGDEWTQAFLTLPTPAPTIGSGLVGLALAAVLLMRRNKS
jgi:hypothetical protein